MPDVEHLQHVRAHLVVVHDAVQHAHLRPELVPRERLHGAHRGAAVAVALQGVRDVQLADVGYGRVVRERQLLQDGRRRDGDAHVADGDELLVRRGPRSGLPGLRGCVGYGGGFLGGEVVRTLVGGERLGGSWADLGVSRDVCRYLRVTV